MRKVYIVTGDTGRYSDFTSWDVAVYLDRQQAQLHLNALLVKVKSLGLTREQCAASKAESRFAHYAKAKEAGIQINQTLDPKLPDPYDGVDYQIEEVELFDHFDQFQDAYNQRGE